MNWTHLFKFSGRAGREEFAAVSLLMQAVSLLATLGGLWVAFGAAERNWLMMILVVVAGLVSIPISLGLWWMSAAVFFRRLHDFNWSGWWYIGYLIVITAGNFMLPKMRWVFTVLGLGIIVFFSVKRASAAPNRFAPQAEPFFPAFFSARRWGLGLLVAATVLLAVSPMIVLLFVAEELFPF